MYKTRYAHILLNDKGNKYKNPWGAAIDSHCWRWGKTKAEARRRLMNSLKYDLATAAAKKKSDIDCAERLFKRQTRKLKTILAQVR